MEILHSKIQPVPLIGCIGGAVDGDPSRVFFGFWRGVRKALAPVLYHGGNNPHVKYPSRCLWRGFEGNKKWIKKFL